MASIFVTIAITSGNSMRCTVRRSSVTRIRSPASNAKSQSWRWQMMINCTSRRGAVHEILDAVNADFAPAFTFDEAMRLLRALEHRHAPVARSFYSVVGRRLQFIDSQLLMRVLDRCLKDGSLVYQFTIASSRKPVAMRTGCRKSWSSLVKATCSQQRHRRAGAGLAGHRPDMPAMIRQ